MLKFLDDRSAEVPYRSPKRYSPGMIYGISCEAPAEFQHPHSILFRKSYMNPYLELEPQRKALLEKEQLSKFNRRHYVKHNPIYEQVTTCPMQEHRVVGEMRPGEAVEDKFKKTYVRELSNSPAAFRHTRGPFGDFVEKNDRYKSVGPLLGKERSNESMLATRKSLYEKSRQSLYERTMNSQAHSFAPTESSIGRNSHLFAQTTKIRADRNRFNSEVKNLLEQRKTSDRFAITASYFPTLNRMYGSHYEPEQQPSSDQESIDRQQRDYEEYDRKMARRLHI